MNEQLKEKIKENRNEWIVYAYSELGLPAEDIAETVELKVKTVISYAKYKFKDLLATAIEMFKDFYKATCSWVNDKLNIEYNRPCAYVIEMFSGDRRQYLKIGKTKNLKRRMYDLSKKYNMTIKVLDLYYTEDEEQALTMENCLRKHYKSKEDCGYVPNDRFTNVFYTQADKKIFTQKQKLLLENF